MLPEEDLNPVEREIEATLASFAPAAVAFGPEEVAFALGKASSLGRAIRWRRTAAGLALTVCVLLAIGLQARFTPSGPIPDARVHQAPLAIGIDRGTQSTPAFEVRPVSGAGTTTYAALREAVLSDGLGALPAPPRDPAGPGRGPPVQPLGGARTDLAGEPPVPAVVRSLLLLGGA